MRSESERERESEGGREREPEREREKLRLGIRCLQRPKRSIPVHIPNLRADRGALEWAHRAEQRLQNAEKPVPRQQLLDT